jgi:hypothetical protein
VGESVLGKNKGIARIINYERNITHCLERKKAPNGKKHPLLLLAGLLLWG